jgi:hypothetical protein
MLYIPVIKHRFLALISLGFKHLMDALPLLSEVVLHRDAAELVASPVNALQDCLFTAFGVDT